MNIKVLLIGSLLGFGVIACATPTVGIQLSDSAGRMGIEETRLGDSRVSTLQLATDSLGKAPVCQSKKVLVKNSRRAYSHETCVYSRVSANLADVEMKSVSYHFIDDLLLRIDLGAPDVEQNMMLLKDRLDQQYGRVAAVADGKPGAYRWQTETDRAELSKDSAGQSFQLRIMDIDAATRAFGL